MLSATKIQSVFFLSFLTFALFFSGFLIFFTPLPLIYFHLKQNRIDRYGPALIMLGVVVFIYLLGLEPLQAWYQKYPIFVWLFPVPGVNLLEFFSKRVVSFMGIGCFVFYIVSSYLISFIFQDPKKIFHKISYSILALFGMAVLFSLFMALPDPGHIFESYKIYMTRGIQEFITLKDQPGSDQMALTYLKSELPQLVDYSLFLFPAFLLGSLSLIFVLNLVIAKRFFSHPFQGLKKIRLSRFCVPFSVVWCVVASLALLLINFKFFENPLLHFVLLNFLIIMALVYFLQGLSIVVDFFHRKKIVGFLQFLFYFFMLIFFQVVAFSLIFLGFFDHWLDVRKLEA